MGISDDSAGGGLRCVCGFVGAFTDARSVLVKATVGSAAGEKGSKRAARR